MINIHYVNCRISLPSLSVWLPFIQIISPTPITGPQGPHVAINYDISWFARSPTWGADLGLLLNIQQLPLFTTEAGASRGSFQEGNYRAQMR